MGKGGGKRKHIRRPVHYHVVEAREPEMGLLERFYVNTGWKTKLACVLAVITLIVVAVNEALSLPERDSMKLMTDLARCKATCITTVSFQSCLLITGQALTYFTGCNA